MCVVSVSRVGTQVVVRLSGAVTDADTTRLVAAVAEVAELVTRRVVVDLIDAHPVGVAGIGFIHSLQDRWSVRLLNAPAAVRALCPVPSPAASA